MLPLQGHFPFEKRILLQKILLADILSKHKKQNQPTNQTNKLKTKWGEMLHEQVFKNVLKMPGFQRLAKNCLLRNSGG